MAQDTIQRIETMIRNSIHITAENKKIYLELLEKLNEEVAELSKEKEDQAVSITGFTKLSTHEAIREEKDQALFDISLEGLSSSVKGFEASYPRLVSTVNAICDFLSKLGI